MFCFFLQNQITQIKSDLLTVVNKEVQTLKKTITKLQEENEVLKHENQRLRETANANSTWQLLLDSYCPVKQHVLKIGKIPSRDVVLVINSMWYYPIDWDLVHRYMVWPDFQFEIILQRIDKWSITCLKKERATAWRGAQYGISDCLYQALVPAFDRKSQILNAFDSRKSCLWVIPVLLGCMVYQEPLSFKYCIFTLVLKACPERSVWPSYLNLTPTKITCLFLHNVLPIAGHNLKGQVHIQSLLGTKVSPLHGEH